MARHELKTKHKVESLRACGYTYGEIFLLMKGEVAKSTISQWCRGVQIEKGPLEEQTKRVAEKLVKARLAASQKAVQRRIENDDHLNTKNEKLTNVLENPAVQKILLGSLYWCEGGKKVPPFALEILRLKSFGSFCGYCEAAFWLTKQNFDVHCSCVQIKRLSN